MLMKAAPSLSPDACLALSIGRALGLLAAYNRLVQRAHRGETASAPSSAGGEQTWTDARGFKHTRITSMEQMVSMFPKRG